MDLMICIRGQEEEHPFLPEITRLGAGIELGSYGMLGIQSEQEWEKRFRLHQAVRAQFPGPIAVHGPFFGMEFAHIDHLIREVVNRRLDMTLDVAVKLQASRVVLHSGITPEINLFQLQDSWLKKNVAFWQGEIKRWAEAGIVIVLENDTEETPDMLLQLIEEVDHPFLGLCLDTGHEHVFSKFGAGEWVRRMGCRLYHIHLHDNDGMQDRHWSIGRGTIDFEPLYAALMEHAPQATISLEVEDRMEVKMGDLRKLVARFTPGSSV